MRVAAFHESRVLGEVDLQPASADCPMCGSPGPSPVGLAQSAPKVELLNCPTCRCVAVSRMPTPTALDDYYSTYYAPGVPNAVTASTPDRIARRIGRYVAGPTTPWDVLDFGGGDGTIAVAILASSGNAGHISLVDNADRTCAIPDGVTVRRYGNLDDLPSDATFDLVVASAVLEHLPDASTALKRLLRLVRTGGTFYARTPYVAPLVSVADRLHVDVDFTFPAHLYDMGQPFWDGLPSWMVEAQSFDVVSSRPSPVETSWRDHPIRTATSSTLKAVGRILGPRWPFVGGWEWAAQRRS